MIGQRILARLLPLLKQAGATKLREIVENRLPGAGVVVDRIAEHLGVEPTEAALETMIDGAPDDVVAAAAQVEAAHPEMWTSLASQTAETNQTMRLEAESKSWLIRHWRPLYALETIFELPLLVVFILVLLMQRRTEEATMLVDFLIVYTPVRLAVLGAYVAGRSFEKGRGAAR